MSLSARAIQTQNSETEATKYVVKGGGSYLRNGILHFKEPYLNTSKPLFLPHLSSAMEYSRPYHGTVSHYCRLASIQKKLLLQLRK